MCGGFHCSKISLQLLNVLYLLVAVLLIGIAAYAKASAVITSFQIAGGIIASGLFLLLISFLGLFAAIKHHQVVLFFYIVILFILFIIQFSVSIACLALTESQVTETIEKVWMSQESSSPIVKDAEESFSCCGWSYETVNHERNAAAENGTNDQYTDCLISQNCQAPLAPSNTTQPTILGETTCLYCSNVIPPMSSSVLEATGGIGLFFSFTEMLGVWLAVRFRNQKDPKANPNQFL